MGRLDTIEALCARDARDWTTRDLRLAVATLKRSTTFSRYSQARLAARLDVSERTLRRWLQLDDDSPADRRTALALQGLLVFSSESPERRKYRNQPVEAFGRRFDSKLEADRYAYLRTMETAGFITDLRAQVPFLLYWPGAEPVPIRIKSKRYSALGRPLRLIVDFCYFAPQDTETLCDADGNVAGIQVEDTKGYATKESRIKIALWELYYGRNIAIVERPDAPCAGIQGPPALVSPESA